MEKMVDCKPAGSTVPSLVDICTDLLGKYACYLPDLDYVNERATELICYKADGCGLLRLEAILKNDPFHREIDLDKHWKALCHAIAVSLPLLAKKVERFYNESDPDSVRSTYFSLRFVQLCETADRIEELQAFVARCAPHLRRAYIPTHAKLLDGYKAIAAAGALRKISAGKFPYDGAALAKFLAEGIRGGNWPELESLSLGCAGIPTEGAIEIIKAIKAAGKIRRIDLEFNGVDVSVVSELVEYYRSRMAGATLQCVKLSHNFSGKNVGIVQRFVAGIAKLFMGAQLNPPRITFL